MSNPNAQPLRVHFDKNLRGAFCHRHSTRNKMYWLLFGQVSRLCHERQAQAN
jgi:hypothetical protein